MSFKELENVVLNRDLPEHRLRQGDLGAVAHVYEPDGLEVEFVSASNNAANGRRPPLIGEAVGP